MRQDDAKIGQKVRAMGKSTHGEAHFGRIGEIDMIFPRGTASVKWPEGNTNAFWLADLEPVVEMKIGDRVKVMRAWKDGEFSNAPTMNCKGEMDSYTGKTGILGHHVSEGSWRVKFPDGVSWAYPEQVLQKVDSKPCILTEKVMVNGVKCRKITGFEGIKRWEDLPEAYTKGCPSFAMIDADGGHQRIFDGNGIQISDTQLVSGKGIAFYFRGEPNIDMGEACQMIFEGDILPETVFQNILIWLKRAGSRLAKIKRREHDAWAGKENVEI